MGICLKCVLEPIELKRYIPKKIFLSTMKNWGLELSNFFDVPKKKIEKKCMFNICFRTHRIKKIGLKINFFFFVNNEKLGVGTWYLFDVPKKKSKKIYV